MRQIHFASFRTQTLLLFLMVLLFSTHSADAQGRRGGPGSEGMAERMKAQIDETIEKLAVSDEKAETVRGILENEMKAREAVVQGFAGQDRSARQGMREKMDALHAETREKVAAVLSEEELKKFDEIQAELRERQQGQFGRGRGQRRQNENH